jgi:hypothetical protein
LLLTINAKRLPSTPVRDEARVYIDYQQLHFGPTDVGVVNLGSLEHKNEQISPIFFKPSWVAFARVDGYKFIHA